MKECFKYRLYYQGIVHDIDKLFNKNHKKTSKHHFEYWGDRDIPSKYLIEMICDWIGAYKVQGGKDISKGVNDWYKVNKDSLKLNTISRYKLEWYLYKITNHNK
jgi:hypothetical protein